MTNLSTAAPDITATAATTDNTFTVSTSTTTVANSSRWRQGEWPEQQEAGAVTTVRKDQENIVKEL